MLLLDSLWVIIIQSFSNRRSSPETNLTIEVLGRSYIYHCILRISRSLQAICKNSLSESINSCTVILCILDLLQDSHFIFVGSTFQPTDTRIHWFAPEFGKGAYRTAQLGWYLAFKRDKRDMMNLLKLLAFSFGLGAACCNATTPQAAQPATNPSTTVSTAPESQTTAADTQATAAEPVKTAADDRVCTMEKRIGSNMRKKVCRSKEQIEEERKAAKEFMDNTVQIPNTNMGK